MIHDEKGRHYAVWDSIEDYCDNARERVLSNACCVPALISPLLMSGLVVLRLVVREFAVRGVSVSKLPLRVLLPISGAVPTGGCDAVGCNAGGCNVDCSVA